MSARNIGEVIGWLIIIAVVYRFVLRPYWRWRRRQYTYSVRDAGNMKHQANLTAQALANEMKRNPAPTPAPASVPASDSLDLGSQLKQLNELHQSGALTADEFQASKAKLLDQG